MTAIQKIGMILAIMVVMVNVMLFVGGEITSDEVPTISRILTNVDPGDFNSTTFQESLILKDSDGNSLASPIGNSSAVTILDFLETLPIVGPVVTLFRIIYELIVTGAFGLVIVMSRIGLPGVIVVPSGLAVFLIFTIALYEHVIGFIAGRGGTR